MCDPCGPCVVQCDPYCPPYGLYYCGPRYLMRNDHSSELIKYKTTVQCDSCTANPKDWITIYRSNLCGRKTSVCCIFPVTDLASLTSALILNLDASVPECKPNYVIVTVTVTGINRNSSSSPEYVVKTYEKCQEVCTVVPLNVPVSLKGDLFNFTFSGGVDPPEASAEITIDWYANKCC